MAFTLTPCGAHSFASAFVSCATPPLLAAYPGTVTPPWKESSDATKMIFPSPRSTMRAPELAREHELRREVDLEHAIPEVVCVLRLRVGARSSRRSGRGCRGAGPSATFSASLSTACPVAEVAAVRHESDGLSAVISAPPRRSRQAMLLTPIDVRAALGERERRRLADATTAAGDEGRLAGEIEDAPADSTLTLQSTRS